LWTNDSGLALRRVGAAGFANATTGGLGTLTAGIALTIAGISNPPVTLILGIGIGATVVWDILIGDQVSNWWFTVFDANNVDIPRGLAPLNQ